MAETTKEKPAQGITEEILCAQAAPDGEAEHFHLMIDALEQLGTRLVNRGFDRSAWTSAVVAMGCRLALEDLGAARASQWMNDCADVIGAAGAGAIKVQ